MKGMIRKSGNDNREFHDELLDSLEERLINYGYTNIKKEWEYEVGNLYGEVDLLTYRNGIWHFYEVKGHHCSKNYAKAKEQYYRFKRAFPEKQVKGIYFSCEKVRRLD